MQIYQAIKSDHEKIRHLLNELLTLEDEESRARERLLDQLHEELIPHERAEEAVFYNSIRAVSTAQDLRWDGFREHQELDVLLRKLQGLDAFDVSWKKTAFRMNEIFTRHTFLEETRIIPLAELLFNTREAEAMAEAFEEMKPEVQDDNISQDTLDMIAGLMPARLKAPLRTFAVDARLGL